MITLKRISKELNDLLIEEAAKQSVLLGRKVSDTELLEKYLKCGLSSDHEKRYIKNLKK